MVGAAAGTFTTAIAAKAGTPTLEHLTLNPNVGALIIRIGFLGPFYYNYNKEPPK